MNAKCICRLTRKIKLVDTKINKSIKAFIDYIEEEKQRMYSTVGIPKNRP